jgi:hypothetical protein
MVETKNVVNQNPDVQGPEIIISCSALIRADIESDPSFKSGVTTFGYKYNPLKLDSNGNEVMALDYYPDNEFLLEARTKGTLFIYTSSDKPKELFAN